MINESIEKLCHQLGLGCIHHPPRSMFGGLLHDMYKIDTAKGTYAVKALNPKIMTREGVIENYIFSEAAARIAQQNHLPVVPAIGTDSDSCLHFVDGRYFMLFEWVDASSITPAEVTAYHCEVIGRMLAQLHSIDFSALSEYNTQKPSYTETNWERYMTDENSSTLELTKAKGLIFASERRVRMAAREVLADLVISHRDMDCKNVLWDKTDQPYLIDWEAAGYINPLQELIDVAMAWSGGETQAFSRQHFEIVVESYVKHGGSIIGDISAVLSYGFKGKLDWLEYNVKRSLGIESSTPEEQALGNEEVLKTVHAIKCYDLLIPDCTEMLNAYKTAEV